ncbi:phosphotransferase family protein [Microlunatus sp. GCM10028923]|uniref:phosphotransferase family protein n=1 Tax=Microlunatus sp. GCM10028923 TaxID=3273400 RepID=UPI00361DB790
MPAADVIHAAVLGRLAPGGSIRAVRPFRRHPLPFPAELTLDRDGRFLVCVVKASTDSDRLAEEAAALRALAHLDFPAPRVLADPFPVETADGPFAVLVMSRLPGEALPWIGVSDIAVADRTCRLLFEAIDRLHALTPRVAEHPLAGRLQHRSLDDELAEAAERDSPWAGTPVVRAEVAVLRDRIPEHRLPLVFSNGDYNPLNVLVDDAGGLGWVDFEYARIEDPLIGLPKFGFWADDSGWALGAQSGLVERFLYRRGISPATFQVRVALRGLTHLHDTSPDDPPRLTLEAATASLS